MVMESSYETKTFTWLMNENKLLTWEILQRRGFVGPGRACFVRRTWKHLQGLVEEWEGY
jgi:hypothetical protein